MEIWDRIGTWLDCFFGLPDGNLRKEVLDLLNEGAKTQDELMKLLKVRNSQVHHLRLSFYLVKLVDEKLVRELERSFYITEDGKKELHHLIYVKAL